MTQTVMNLPTTIQETWVRSLDQEDPLEKGMATYSSILAWRIPWMEEVSESDITESHTHSLTHSLPANRLSKKDFWIQEHSLEERRPRAWGTHPDPWFLSPVEIRLARAWGPSCLGLRAMLALLPLLLRCLVL